MALRVVAAFLQEVPVRALTRPLGTAARGHNARAHTGGFLGVPHNGVASFQNSQDGGSMNQLIRQRTSPQCAVDSWAAAQCGQLATAPSVPLDKLWLALPHSTYKSTTRAKYRVLAAGRLNRVPIDPTSSTISGSRGIEGGVTPGGHHRYRCRYGRPVWDTLQVRCRCAPARITSTTTSGPGGLRGPVRRGDTTGRLDRHRCWQVCTTGLGHARHVRMRCSFFSSVPVRRKS